MGVYNTIKCVCPECKEIVEFQSKADDDCKTYKVGEIIPFVIALDISRNPINCKCGCFCEVEFVEHKMYSASIR